VKGSLWKFKHCHYSCLRSLLLIDNCAAEVTFSDSILALLAVYHEQALFCFSSFA
jgi:hypothetical protein